MIIIIEYKIIKIGNLKSNEEMNLRMKIEG